MVSELSSLTTGAISGGEQDDDSRSAKHGHARREPTFGEHGAVERRPELGGFLVLLPFAGDEVPIPSSVTKTRRLSSSHQREKRAGTYMWRFSGSGRPPNTMHLAGRSSAVEIFMQLPAKCKTWMSDPTG
eukprot:scaffold1355_cov268-Pinguiococcus_pyrenoidosus.AAC.26